MIDGNTRDDGTPCPTGSGACRYSRPADRSDSFDNWAAQLGTIHELDQATSAYVNIARAFRAPQATELYRLQGNQTVSDIKSTRLYSLETGLRGARGSWDYDVAVYYMEKKNYLFRDSARFVVSDGETEHYGIELELFRPLGDQLDLGITAAFARHLYAYDSTTDSGEAIVDGNDIDTAPRSLASTRLGWNFGPGGRAELEWVHVGSYYTDAANLHKYLGHDLLHLRASKQLTRQLRLFGRIHNLTDRRYAERADWNNIGAGTDRYFPGQPFAVFFGLEASL
jgi:outer membrane receptor protein involved in Fe transport